MKALIANKLSIFLRISSSPNNKESINIMADPQTMSAWQEKVSWAQDFRQKSLEKVEPRLEGLPTEQPLSSQDLPKMVLTPREIEITEKYTVKELLDILRERKISVEEVTRAFLRRAALAQAAVSHETIVLSCYLLSSTDSSGTDCIRPTA